MGEEIEELLVTYLKDANAMEHQSLQTLEAAVKVAGDPQLEALYKGHVRETAEHVSIVEGLLEEHDSSGSKLRDLAARATALGIGLGVAAQPDTPAKLLTVAFAFENFEIASYELLRRVAERAGDSETVGAVDRILVNERQAAEKLAASYDLALQASGILEGAEHTPAAGGPG
jgi:ferritin-like metal-binding protein YciE